MKSRLFCLLVLFAFPLAAQDHSESFEELSNRATAARLANDIPNAVEFYRKALLLNQKWAPGWLYLGTLLYDADQYAGGRDALTRFVALEPKVAAAWGLLGLCEFETADYPQALTHIRKSLAAGPGEQPQMDAVLHYHEAVLLARTGDFDQALQKFALFLRNASPQPTVLAALGIAALREPLVPEEIPPDRQDLFIAAGKASYATLSGDYESADTAYRDLLERFPSSPGVHSLHGFYLLARSPALAMDEFRRELELNPKNASAQAMLAWVLLNRGEASAALPYATKAAAGAPTLPMSTQGHRSWAG